MIFIIFFILFIVLVYYYNNNTSVYIKSNIDGNYYSVQKTPDPQESADTLGLIYQNLIKLENFVLNNQRTPADRDFLYRIKNKIKPSLLAEADLEDGVTSYTLNKTKIYLCIRNKPHLEIADENVLMHVVLHELAHVLSNGIVREHEHEKNKEFRDLFDYLLKTAVKIGINVNVNGTAPYCGISV